MNQAKKLNILTIFVIITVVLLIVNIGSNMGGYMLKQTTFKELTVTSDAFDNNGIMPIRYTGRGEDVSPNLNLLEISKDAQSIAIIMDDLDIPFIGAFNHWVIWNIPIQGNIPENITHGDLVSSLGGAIQGVGYGKHRYRGPKPPLFIKKYHRYQFHVYILDCSIDLESNGRKNKLLKAMDGHIIQYGSLTGKFRNQQ